MTPLENLLTLAKQSFDVAAALEVNKPEGMAILMTSGIILTGYTQPVTAGNVARDTLRAAIAMFPTGDKVRKSLMDHFTIAQVALVTSAKNTKPSESVIATLEEYPALVKGATLYVASPKIVNRLPPTVKHLVPLSNQLNT